MKTSSGGRSQGEADVHRAVSAQGLACADVTDALGRLHRHRAHITGLVSPVPTRRLFGRVVTISFFPACAERLGPEKFDFGILFDQAVRGATADPAHTVLVMTSNGHTDTSLAGGTKLSRLTNVGLAGVLTDGRLRDFDELAQERTRRGARGKPSPGVGARSRRSKRTSPSCSAESVYFQDSTSSATHPEPCSFPKPTSTTSSKPRSRSEETTHISAPGLRERVSTTHRGPSGDPPGLRSGDGGR